MHGLSKIKTASNGTTNYFDLKLQTSDDKTVRLVCFSPPKRSVLLTAYEKRSPVKIAANLNPKKRLNSDLEEYTVPKSAKIMTLRSKSLSKKRIRIPLFKTQKPDSSVTH